MKPVIIILVSLIFISGQCNPEGKNCHHKIILINNSNKDIISASKISNTSNKCILSGPIIKPTEIDEMQIGSCWEDRLGNGQTEEIYIVDPNHFNTLGVFYDCDSVEIRNTILKHYVLTLDDLKKSNFTVTYP